MKNSTLLRNRNVPLNFVFKNIAEKILTKFMHTIKLVIKHSKHNHENMSYHNRFQIINFPMLDETPH